MWTFQSWFLNEVFLLIKCDPPRRDYVADNRVAHLHCGDRSLLTLHYFFEIGLCAAGVFGEESATGVTEGYLVVVTWAVKSHLQ